MAQRTVLSVPLYGTADVRYGKVAYHTGGDVRYGTNGEIWRTGNQGTVRYGDVHT